MFEKERRPPWMCFDLYTDGQSPSIPIGKRLTTTPFQYSSVIEVNKPLPAIYKQYPRITSYLRHVSSINTILYPNENRPEIIFCN